MPEPPDGDSPLTRPTWPLKHFGRRRRDGLVDVKARRKGTGMVQGIEPFRVGFLDEGIMDDAGAFEESIGTVIRFRFDEAVENTEVDRPIELVVRSGVGLPRGTAKAVCDAWTQLDD